MKTKLLLAQIALISLIMSSCIKDEPLGKETDIVSFTIDGENFVSSEVSNETVTVSVTEDTDLTKIIPRIELSEGASVSPESGTVQDFSAGPVHYVVTSEDRKYDKRYTVSIIKPSSMPLTFDFEDWEQSSQGFYNMMVKNSNGRLVKMWDSGNPGIAFVNAGKDFATIPTSDFNDVYSGKYAAKLQTLKGNVSMGDLKIPIFSGSLFFGSFNLLSGIKEPLKCLRLGQSFSKSAGKPVMFTGYYKYKVGKPYIYLNENKEEVSTEDITDQLSIYSVLFETTDQVKYLNGITIMDSPNIVARADWRPETASITDSPAEGGKGFIKFEIPFKYKEGVKLDFENKEYKLVIMFASSKDGNEYKGSLGSTLIVDEVEIVCEDIE
ncbi:PCMD domain-containing protein [Prevotella sp. 10(H)]|uniref:PCMD domain-containing protein n=1 Tax=Prevotella sp. 10(H) TaxID=1158294 RepID=UPI0004A6E74F|nr:PCMD domain-containing protein [Prevotella sp. 10(H)]